ncbi:MAG: CRAL-TRIO domain-containing protein, partial [Piptocephalis tieghemiana]
ELWGVLLDPTSTDPRIPVILSKFLRANTDNFEAAEVSLRQTLVWRAEFSLPTLLASEVFPETLGDNVGFIYRKDTKGRPVIYNRYGGLDTKVIFGDLDRFVRWRVRLMEQSMLQCDFLHVDSLLVVHDYAGVGVLSYDKYAKAASKKTIAVLQEYYPECLAVKLFIHIPWWGASIYKLVSRWIPEATKKKMSIVSTTETHSALCQYINEEDLPTVYQKPSAQMKGKGSKALQGNSVSTDAPMALEGDG